MLAGGRVGPLGIVIGVPLALAGAFVAYSSDDYCSPRVRAALGDVPKWVQATFGATPVVTQVADAARRGLRGGNGPAVLASVAGVSSEARAAEVTSLGVRSGVSTVILADVYVEFGEMLQGCKVKLAARADVRVQPLGQAEMTAPRYSVWAEQPDVPVEGWAADPKSAQDQLDVLLDQLGTRLLESYRDRMGCAERDCGW